MTDLPQPAVFIFGAGATRGALEGQWSPPPVDTDFFDIAARLIKHGSGQLARDVLDSVWNIYREISGVGLERYYRDIETREIIGKFAKTANQPKDWRKHEKDLVELIRRVFIRTTTDLTGTPKKSKLHEDLLSALRPGDTIVTFNYDLLIEESFSSAKLWNPLNGYSKDVRVRGSSHSWCKHWFTDRKIAAGRKSKILLLKLHGSLNWTLYNNGDIRLKPYPYAVRSRSGQPVFEEISILPPGWNKRIDRKPYKLFWREARLRLEKCKTLTIIGYSLPDTDLLAHSLLAEVVRLRAVRKNYFSQLHIADPDEAVKSKLIKLFNPALGPYGKVFKYSGFQELAERWQSDIE